MRKMTCAECGGTATVSKRNYKFDQMGIPVELHKIEVIDCPNCGETPVIPNINGLMDTLALAVLCNPCTLTGAEVAFLRKYVNKSAREFAKYLKIEHTSLSKIENQQRKLRSGLDAQVRLTIVAMDEKLRERLKELIDRIPDIKERCESDNEEILIDPKTGNYQYA